MCAWAPGTSTCALCREACGHLRVRMLSQMLFWGRKAAIWLSSLRPKFMLWPITWPLSHILKACMSPPIVALGAIPVHQMGLITTVQISY